MRRILKSEIKSKVKKDNKISLFYMVDKVYIKVWEITGVGNKQYKLETDISNFKDFLTPTVQYFINSGNKDLQKLVNTIENEKFIITSLTQIWDLINFNKQIFIDENLNVITSTSVIYSPTYEKFKDMFPYRKSERFGKIKNFESPSLIDLHKIFIEALRSLNFYVKRSINNSDKEIIFQYLNKDILIHFQEYSMEIDELDNDYGFYTWYQPIITTLKDGLKSTPINSLHELLNALLKLNKYKRVGEFSKKYKNTFTKTCWCIPEYTNCKDGAYYVDGVFDSEKKRKNT